MLVMYATMIVMKHPHYIVVIQTKLLQIRGVNGGGFSYKVTNSHLSFKNGH